MMENDKRIIEEQLFPGMIVTNKGYVAMSDDEKEIYYNLLEQCPSISGNDIVQMKLKRTNNVVEFNGLVGWKGTKKGFSIYGFIDFDDEVIRLYIDQKNNNNYEFRNILFSELNIQGKVK